MIDLLGCMIDASVAMPEHIGAKRNWVQFILPSSYMYLGTIEALFLG